MTSIGPEGERARARTADAGAKAPEETLSRAYAVVMLDEAGRVAWASPQASELTGWAPERLVGSPGLDLVHPEDRVALSRLLADLRGSPLAISMTLRLVGASGEVVPVEAEVTNLVDEPGLSTVSIRLRRLAKGTAPGRPRRRPHHPQTVLDSLHEGVVVLLGDGTVLSCNDAAPHLVGVPRGSLVGRRFNEAVAAALGPKEAVLDENGHELDPLSDLALLSVDRDASATVRGLRRASGEVRWLGFRATAVGPPPGLADAGSAHLLLSISDITALRRADEERRAALDTLANEREFLGALVGDLDAAVIACDAKGALTLTNATFRLFGDYRPDQVAPGSPPPVEGLFWPDGTPLELSEHPLCEALAGARVSGRELRFRPPSGAPERAVSASATVLRSENGRVLGAVAGFQDVTDVTARARELTELALHDPLTGCANRLLLTDRVVLAAENARREHSSVGLLLVDLDHFKLVNDIHGHLVGDEVLVGVARRLRAVVRPGDTVARYGGDEFVVLCEIAGGAAELETVRERVVSRLAEPFRVGERTLEVGASVGTTLAPGEESDLNRLVRAADAEMYEQKGVRASTDTLSQLRSGRPPRPRRRTIA